MSSLIRREPFFEPQSLRGVMDRLFDQAIVHPGELAHMGEGLALDMYETDEAVVVKAVMPGVDVKDVEVRVVGDSLTIRGEVKVENDVEEEAYTYRERRYGQFCRVVTMPSQVDSDKAAGEFKNGILTLTLPKVEEAKAKTVRVVAK